MIRDVSLAGARILAVDDVPTNLDVLLPALESDGYQVLVATNGTRALEVAGREHIDLILLDVMMEDLDGFEVCRRLKRREEMRDVPVIFLTASAGTHGVLEGFRAGGVDYVTKPFRKEEVLARIRTHLTNAFLKRALEEKNAALEAEIAERERLDSRLSMISQQESDRWGIEGFLGESRTIQKILQNIQLLENADSVSVLITGESGTGKELVARAIHARSPRAGGPFVAVNCAAIPAALAESTLFGHLKGAFTGADRDHEGYFGLADGGTLFLDEIGTMLPELQPKLLRVVEDGIIQRVGSAAEKRVDVRIVAATNAPDAFRDDLYFRLARFTIELPPLRRRKEDIPLLARHFVRLFAGEMGVAPPDLTADALRALDAHDYPGNVRELKNIVERALIQAAGGPITPEHLHLPRRPHAGDRPAASGVPSGPGPSDVPSSHEPPTAARAPSAPGEATAADGALPLDLHEAERILVQRALDRTDGNVSAAARLLGIDRNKIYRIRKRGR